MSVDNRPIIGFDLDGVLIDHTKNKITVAKLFGFDVAPRQTPSESLRTLIPYDTLQEFQKVLYDDPTYAYHAPLMEGALDVVQRVMRRGWPMHLISRRKTSHSALEVLKRQGLWPTFFHEKNTFFVREIADKDIEARRLGVTHYIDDERQVIHALSSVAHRFLFDPHQISQEPEGYTRVSSWKEFCVHVDL